MLPLDSLQVGVLAPEAVPTGKLCTGQVGYLITGMKTTKSARVGDTWHLAKQPVEALPGFKPAKSMVFSGRLKLTCRHKPNGVAAWCWFLASRMLLDLVQ